MDTLLKAGHDWVVAADLKSYFDTIPDDRLLALVKERVADGHVLALVESFLRAEEFVFLCCSQAEAQNVLAAVRQWMCEAGLTLHLKRHESSTRECPEASTSLRESRQSGSQGARSIPCPCADLIPPASRMVLNPQPFDNHLPSVEAKSLKLFAS